ncbi:MAG: hypothetical protein SGBAC_001260 [Bacillariaceae sp.]
MTAEIQAADLITNSYFLTEVAANQDPEIAKKNLAIAEQKKAFEKREAAESSMSPNELVVESWATVTKIPDYQKVAGEILFRRIFELNGDALGVFSFAKSYKPDDEALYKDPLFALHSTTVVGTITAAIGLLGSGEVKKLISVLKDLGGKHAQFNFTNVHYDLVGESLLYTLEKALGDAFTPKVKQSWVGVYNLIAQQMMVGAAEAKADSHLTLDQKAEKKAAEAAVSASYLLTEAAANEDEAIAEQNRLIAEQKKKYEQTGITEEEGESSEPEKSATALVVESWATVSQIPNYQKVAGEILFRRIFELNGDALAFFSFAKTYNPDDDALYKDPLFRVHAAAVVGTVTAAVDLLEKEDMDTLISVLRDLGAKHAQFNFVKVHYELVGESLLYTLEKGLGFAFTPKVKEAWVGVYDVIAKQMMLGAEEAKKIEEVQSKKTPNELVVESWATVTNILDYEKVAGEILFRRLFELNGDALGFFSFAKTYKPDDDALYKDPLCIAHSTAVVGTVTAAVGLLEQGDMDTLVSVLNDLGARHAEFNFTKSHYDLVGESLLFTLETALDKAFTPKVKEAWVGVYGVITEQMMKGAAAATVLETEEKQDVLWV